MKARGRSEMSIRCHRWIELAEATGRKYACLRQTNDLCEAFFALNRFKTDFMCEIAAHPHDFTREEVDAVLLVLESAGR